MRKIAGLLKLNHSTVIRHVKQLELRGYISKQVRSTQVLYSILPLGMELMHHPVKGNLTEGSKLAPPRENEIKIRLHRLQIKFDLVNPVESRKEGKLSFFAKPHPMAIAFRDHPSKTVPLEHWDKNVIQFEDFTAIVSTKSLIITGIQRYLNTGESVQGQEADIMSEILPFAEQVEERIRRISPRFRLKRLDRGVLAGNIISREYAFEHHPIAESVVKDGKKMLIKAQDGKPRIIVDQSKGHPELETVHEETAAEDADMIDRNTEVLADIDLRQAIQVLTTQVSMTTELAKHATTAQDQMDQVISALGQITSFLGGLTGGLSR